MTIKLACDTIDNKDVDSLVSWLKTYPRLTKGEYTFLFEDAWSKFIGTKFSTFVNSGSSANLIMLYALMEAKKLSIGDKVVVPAVSWATDVAPIIQLGLTPILCDCNLEDFSLDVGHLANLIIEHNPKVAIVVSVLGFIPNMPKLVDLCKSGGVILLEDCCESFGSKFGDTNLGNFGLMSTFSTYFGHHISTIEGGVVCTNDSEMNDILKSIRNHGWGRDWSDEKKEAERNKWGVTEFEAMYTFYHAGFNVRATDLQAYIGVEQLHKANWVISTRNRNYLEYCKQFGHTPQDRGLVSNFAYPIISKNRYNIVKALIAEDIEVRPLICGSMGRQPMYISKYGSCPLKNADTIHFNGLYLPNHPGITTENISKIYSIVMGHM